MSELTPYLCVADARAAIAWYTQTLGAEVTYDPIEMPDGRIGHVEMSIDRARWMMADEFPEVGIAAPAAKDQAAVTLHLSVDNVDALVERVVAAGVPMDRGPEDDSLAGRIAIFHDPFGHRWYLSTPN